MGIDGYEITDHVPLTEKEEKQMYTDIPADMGVDVSMCEVYAKGGEGGRDLAEKVVETIRLCADNDTKFKPLYNVESSIKDKVKTIAQEIYRADGVIYTPEAEKAIAILESYGEKASVIGRVTDTPGVEIIMK